MIACQNVSNFFSFETNRSHYWWSKLKNHLCAKNSVMKLVAKSIRKQHSRAWSSQNALVLTRTEIRAFSTKSENSAKNDLTAKQIFEEFEKNQNKWSTKQLLVSRKQQSSEKLFDVEFIKRMATLSRIEINNDMLEKYKRDFEGNLTIIF